ncbi:MAG: hypothetical protein ACM3KM_02495 [Acidobacteriaceae bacterium]
MTEIIPAIMTNDISDFRKKYAELFALSHFFTKIHVDFSDGDFVEGKTIEVKQLNFLKSTSTLIAHLMVNNPKDYFQDVKNAKFKFVSFHFESFEQESEITETIAEAKKFGLKTGLCINPETKLYEAAKFLDKVDFVQLMGVVPGGQGRAFEPSTIDKIKELRKLLKSGIICVDGGIKVGIVRDCVLAGANWLTAGSAIWRSDNQRLAVEALRADSEIQE